MIHEVEGDILLSKAEVIAHGVAPSDNFTSGLALHLREQWPAMVKDFRHYCHTAHPKPGELWTWGGTGGKRIVNLLTQEPAEERSGRPGKASLENVNHSLRALRELIKTEKYRHVALPKLATGVGGLDWMDVLPLIRKHLADSGATVYVYSVYHKGVAANEPA